VNDLCRRSPPVAPGEREKRRPSVFTRRLVWLMVHTIRVGLFGRIQVLGRDHIPRQGPYIVLTNHVDILDTGVILMAFPLMDWSYFIGEKWRSHLLLGPFLTLMGAVYIRKREPNLQVFRSALEVLRGGGVLGIAPEGGRSRERSLSMGQDGAAFLAHRAGVPVLPVGLVNTDRVFDNWKRLRRTTAEVRVGKPFLLPRAEGVAKKSLVSAYTHYMMIHIAALLPVRYRGYYGESPALAALLKGDDPWDLCLGSTPLHLSANQFPEP
jgi:1-acyl-sn-glycerol-3-phosphate acyltransferase